MSEFFRRHIEREPPPAALIRFRCAKLHRTIVGDVSVAEHNTIYDVLRSRGWKEAEGENDWHIYWTDKDWISQIYDKIHLAPHQHVNHFLNHYELTRKDLMVKNLKRSRRLLEREGRHEEAQRYNVFPTTFVLPTEYSMFVEDFKKHMGSTWIMKPVGRSQGSGIFLIRKLAEINQWQPAQNKEEGSKDPELYVVQRYLDNPMLIGGKKFDIRLFVAVTSYAPLTVYMHRGGFCRFSMSRYSNDRSDMADLGQHLTNVAVQKHSGKKAYQRTGAKWDVERLKRYLLGVAGVGVVNQIFSDIESIVLHSLLSVQKVMINDKHSFELYGYDIMIDAHYKPWLLEVNASPSLTANTVADYDMKFGMLDDLLTMLDLESYLSGSELQIGGFDLLYRDGVRYSPPDGSVFSSYLGSFNNRLVQLERLAKTRALELSGGRSRRASNGGAEARCARPWPEASSEATAAPSRPPTRG